MCLAIPGRISSPHENWACRWRRLISAESRARPASAYFPGGAIGDYVLVHVGFAISKVDEEEAARTYQYLAEMDQLELDDAAGTARERSAMKYLDEYRDQRWRRRLSRRSSER